MSFEEACERVRNCGLDGGTVDAAFQLMALEATEEPERVDLVSLAALVFSVLVLLVVLMK